MMAFLELDIASGLNSHKIATPISGSDHLKDNLYGSETQDLAIWAWMLSVPFRTLHTYVR